MGHLPPELLAVARSQGGVFLARQAVVAGVDHHHLERLRQSGAVHRVRRGGYGLGPGVEGEYERHLLRTRAAMLALGVPSWASHQTAAVVHGLPLFRPDLSLVHVTRRRTSSSRTEGGIDHHDGDLPEHHRSEVDGIRVVSLGRAVLDAARTATFEQGLVLADGALRAGLRRDDLAEVLDACRDWPGAAIAGRVVAFADGRAESVGESLARALLICAGLAPDALQVEIRTPGGLYRADLGWIELGVVLEFDGKIKYGRDLAPGGDPAEAAWRERRRELAIEAAGWVVVRVTWAEVVYHPEVVVARVREAIARARRLGRRAG